jgi:putative NADH-flavin reductase
VAQATADSLCLRPLHKKPLPYLFMTAHPHMPSLALLGATGNLGRYIAAQALAQGWALSVAVRNRARLDAEVAARAQVVDMDLQTASLEHIAAFAAGHAALVCCAGTVTQGAAFVRLIDKVVSALESLPDGQRPVCWFLAGAGVLPLDGAGRLGVDLPKVRDTYWPHRQNYERLRRSSLDWRLLCPGPMVDQPALGWQRLRMALDALPTPLPAMARHMPGALVLPMFALKIPEMIIPYADAAAVILAHLGAHDLTARRRVGLALPVGVKGQKPQRAAQPHNQG